MNVGTANTEVQHDWFNFHVNYFSQLILAFKVIKWSTKTLFFFLFNDLFDLIHAGEHDLRVCVAPASRLIQNILVKADLFFTIRDLINGTIEDKTDAVRPTLQPIFGRLHDLIGKEFSVSLPELPKQIGVPVGALLNKRLVGDFALND